MKKEFSQKTTSPNPKSKLKEANYCIGIGAGVGLLGVGTAITIGAVCPLCYIVSPALIGTGLVARNKARNKDQPKTE